MLNHKYTRSTLNIILTLIVFYLLKQLPYLRNSLQTIITIVFIPLLLGGFFYYLLRPVVRFLTGFVKFRVLAIIITFSIILALLAFTSYFGGHIISSQWEDLLDYFTDFYNQLEQGSEQSSFWINDYLSSILNKLNLQQRLTGFLEQLIRGMRNNIGNMLSTITNIGTAIVLIPFVLFYLLLDEDRIGKNVLNVLPRQHRDSWTKTLHHIDQALASYLGGQLIVALILGLLTYIGYLIIGLPNALILAFIGMITSFIPFIGPIIGGLPALLIGITSDILLALKVVIVITIVQQLEGNLIRPHVQGGRLNIHPLIVIFMVLIFIVLFGFLGALFAIPIYAVFKIILQEQLLNRNNSG